MSIQLSKWAKQLPFLSHLALAALLLLPAAAGAQQRWLSVPETPSLPRQTSGGHADLKTALIWYATYGDAMRPTVMLLHGGGGSSGYWGHLVRDLMRDHHVVVLDSRGHGRSTNEGDSISYEQMGADAIAVLDQIGIKRTSVVGWSDGANTGFYLALRYPERITQLVAFAGNATPAGYQPNTNPSTMAVYVARTKREYERLSPHPDRYAGTMKALSVMWRTQPTLTVKDFARIKTPTAIFHAEYDEVIRRSHSEEIARWIPGAQFVLLPDVSHFAPLQDPGGFSAALQGFLDQ